MKFWSLGFNVSNISQRNVLVLSIAQAILGIQMPTYFVLGSLVGQKIAPNSCLATMPISLIVLGCMICAPNLSKIMQYYGRAYGFTLGALGGAFGSLISASGIFYENFYLFLLGSFISGSYMSAQGFYRFAVTDTAEKQFHPKAISFVLAAGLLSAFLANYLIKNTNNLISDHLYLGTYLVLIILNIMGIFIFRFLKIPIIEKKLENKNNNRNLNEMLKNPIIFVSIICAMVSYSLMNLVMTSTPIAVIGCGFTLNDAADVVFFHILAMYIPSFFTGFLIKKFGFEKVIFLGMFLLTISGVIAITDINIENFYFALIFLGIGWNFGFIGSTSMLTSAHSSQERGTIQGFNDLAVFGLVAIASLSSGGLMNCTSTSTQFGWQSVNFAMIPFLLIAYVFLFKLLFLKRNI